MALGSVSAITVPAHAANNTADSLATPITGRTVQELWPFEVAVSVVRLGASGDPVQEASGVQTPCHDVPLPTRSAVVPDGHRLHFGSKVATPRGLRRFEVDVVARHHPDAVELEWDLEVSDARFRPIGWGDYLLHRLRLGSDLELEPESLKIARSDIVSTQGPYRHRVQIDGVAYEIRIEAHTSRG